MCNLASVSLKSPPCAATNQPISLNKIYQYNYASSFFLFNTLQTQTISKRQYNIKLEPMHNLHPHSPHSRLPTAKWTRDDDKSHASHLQNTRQLNRTTSSNPYLPSQKSLSRLESARRTIEEVILQLGDKRDMNDEALREIRSVNSQIIEDFRNSTHTDRREKIKEASSIYYMPEHRRPHAISSFDLGSISQGQEQTTVTLRNRLNQEIQRSNEMRTRISHMEEQNRLMKREQQMSFGPKTDHQTLITQNQNLRRQISTVMNLPNSLLAELEQLKRQNQQLRSDTISLLKKSAQR